MLLLVQSIYPIPKYHILYLSGMTQAYTLPKDQLSKFLESKCNLRTKHISMMEDFQKNALLIQNLTITAQQFIFQTFAKTLDKCFSLMYVTGISQNVTKTRLCEILYAHTLQQLLTPTVFKCYDQLYYKKWIINPTNLTLCRNSNIVPHSTDYSLQYDSVIVSFELPTICTGIMLEINTLFSIVETLKIIFHLHCIEDKIFIIYYAKCSYLNPEYEEEHQSCHNNVEYCTTDILKMIQILNKIESEENQLTKEWPELELNQ